MQIDSTVLRAALQPDAQPHTHARTHAHTNHKPHLYVWFDDCDLILLQLNEIQVSMVVSTRNLRESGTFPPGIQVMLVWARLK